MSRRRTNNNQYLSTMKPTFVTKLWLMINDDRNHHLISWNSKGSSFLVKSREQFVLQILPKYFKHSNFASFIRQLNMYGWNKVQDLNSGSLNYDTSNGNGERWEFINPLFQKGKPQLLDKIVRNRPSKNKSNKVNTDIVISEDRFRDMTSLVDELQSKQTALNEQLLRYKKENEWLYHELYLTKQRSSHSMNKMDKIVGFLGKVYYNDWKPIDQNQSINDNQLGQIDTITSTIPLIENVSNSSSLTNSPIITPFDTPDLHNYNYVKDINDPTFSLKQEDEIRLTTPDFLQSLSCSFQNDEFI